MYAFFSSINANAFWNHIVGYLMPAEGIDVAPPMTPADAEGKRPRAFTEVAHSRQGALTGFGTTMAEARTLATYAALTGVVYPLASVMPELPAERSDLLKRTLPPMPIMPVDLFSRGTDMRWGRFKDVDPDDYIHNYPEVLDLKVNGVAGGRGHLRRGRRHQLAEGAGHAGALVPRHARAPGGVRYAVFDYWEQRLLGVFTDTIPLDVAPHDTRVILVHPLQPHPQLVGISRHITGEHSMLALEWEAATRTLRGTSQGVAGEDYALFVQVPQGASVTRVQCDCRLGGDLDPTAGRRPVAEGQLHGSE